MLDKFVPVDMTTDLSNLSQLDKQVLQTLIQVADILDDVYLRQTYGDNALIRA
jgi:hypothetical protein